MKFEMLVDTPKMVKGNGYSEDLHRVLFTPIVETTRHGTEYHQFKFRTGVRWNVFPNDYWHKNVQLWFDGDKITRKIYKDPLLIPTHNIMQSFAWSPDFIKTGVILTRLTEDRVFFMIPCNKRYRKHDYFIFEDSWTGDYRLNDDLTMWY